MASRTRIKPFLPRMSSLGGPSLLTRTTLSKAPIPRPSPWYYRVQYPSMCRAFSSSGSSRESNDASEGSLVTRPNADWHSDLLKRVGRCIIFGCDPFQLAQAAAVVRSLNEEWRALIAGSIGFLTDGSHARRAIRDQQVAWGEQDSFVGFCLILFPFTILPPPPRLSRPFGLLPSPSRGKHQVWTRDL